MTTFKSFNNKAYKLFRLTNDRNIYCHEYKTKGMRYIILNENSEVIDFAQTKRQAFDRILNRIRNDIRIESGKVETMKKNLDKYDSMCDEWIHTKKEPSVITPELLPRKESFRLFKGNNFNNKIL